MKQHDLTIALMVPRTKALSRNPRKRFPSFCSVRDAQANDRASRVTADHRPRIAKRNVYAIRAVSHIQYKPISQFH
jgi:hypothetical protein